MIFYKNLKLDHFLHKNLPLIGFTRQSNKDEAVNLFKRTLMSK